MVLSAGICFLVGASTAHATLTTIGQATYSGTDYSLIWDGNNNGNSVVWLDYSNTPSDWASQTAWAAGLDGQLSISLFEGYRVTWGTGDWRLPGTPDAKPVLGYDGTTTAGYLVTSSEFGHLFYDELGNQALVTPDKSFNFNGGLMNTGPFTNLEAFPPYWSTDSLYNDEYPDAAWLFDYSFGVQNIGDASAELFAMAIRTGEVTYTSTPEPTTMILFGFGLAGLAAVSRRKRK